MRNRILKYFTESLEEDVLDYTKEPSVADWSAKDLAISYGNSKRIGTIGGFEARKYIEDPLESQSYVNIGLFDKQNIVAGIAYYYTNDPEKYGISKKIPVVDRMVVNKEYRGKGLSKELYLALIKSEGILFSDVTLFGPTAQIWEKFIPKISGVEMFNFNDVSGEYTEFNVDQYRASQDLRLVAVLNEKLKNTIRNKMRSLELVTEKKK